MPKVHNIQNVPIDVDVDVDVLYSHGVAIYMHAQSSKHCPSLCYYAIHVANRFQNINTHKLWTWVMNWQSPSKWHLRFFKLSSESCLLR